LASIKIRVGAALDTNAATVFQPLERAAERARKSIQSSLNSAGKAPASGGASKYGIPSAEFQKMAREYDAALRRMASSSAKSSDALVKDVAKSARERVKLEKQAAREIERELASATRAKERAERPAAAANRRFAERTGLRVWGNVGGGVGVGGAVGAGAALARRAGSELLRGYGVETSLAAHMQSNVGLEAGIVDLVNSAYQPGVKGAAGVRQDAGALNKEIRKTATETGFAPEAALEGLREYTKKTGDLETARATFKDLAVLAQASGTELEHMISAAAEVGNQLGDVPDKGEAIVRVMRGIAGQGKLGAVEISDLAKQMAKIAGQAPKFGGNVENTIAELGGLTQAARMKGGAATASIAATSTAGFVNTLSTPARRAQFEAAGIKIEKDGRLRSVNEIILASLAKRGGDTEGFKKLFANVQGARGAEGYRNIFLEHGGGQGDAKKDLAALREVAAAMQRFKDISMGQGEIADSFAAKMASTKSQVQIVNNKLAEMAETISGGVLSALREFEPAIRTFGAALATAAGGIKDVFLELIGDKAKAQQAKDFGTEVGAANANSKARALAEKQSKLAEGELVEDENGAIEGMSGKRYSRAAPAAITEAEAGAGAKQADEFKAALAAEQARVNKEFAPIEANRGGYAVAGAAGIDDVSLRQFVSAPSEDEDTKRLQAQAKKYLADEDRLRDMNQTFEKLNDSNLKILRALETGIVVKQQQSAKVDGDRGRAPGSAAPAGH
jgi:hypothetical protein